MTWYQEALRTPLKYEGGRGYGAERLPSGSVRVHGGAGASAVLHADGHWSGLTVPAWDGFPEPTVRRATADDMEVFSALAKAAGK